MRAISILLAALALVTRSQQQTLCDQYAYYATNGYELNNNLWGRNSATSGSQCTYYDGLSGSGIRWHTTWTWQGSPNNVKSYVYSGQQMSSKRLVNQIGSMPTTAQWSYDTSNIRCNVAYDLFTATDPNHATSSGDFELMIWLARYDVYPIGSSQGQVSVGGRNWELWYGYNGAMQVYSFVATSTITNYNGNIKDFFNWLASNRNYPANNQYLISQKQRSNCAALTESVPANQFGTEAFTGGPATFTVSQWSASINSGSVTTGTTPPVSTTSSSGSNCAAKWGQCGGQGWTGATCCQSGSTCQAQNQWYSQCL